MMEIDKTYQEKLRKQFNPDGSDIRKAQLKMLELLRFLDKICKENNLTYFLSGGTLLGAARHGGFIPWDDDVDVYMPRKDALKLKKIMGNKIHEGFVILQNTSTDPNYLNSSWMTLRDINSEYLSDEICHQRLKYRGFQVDIFIIEKGISEIINKPLTWMHSQLIFRPWVGRKMKYFRFLSNFHHRIFDNIITPFLRIFKFNKKYGIGYGNLFHLYYDPETLFPIKEIEFEGYYFYAPNNIDKFLTYQYGNWRELPPKNKRMTAHNFKFKIIK